MTILQPDRRRRVRAPTRAQAGQDVGRQLSLFCELASEVAARKRQEEAERGEERAFHCLDCGIDTSAIDEYYGLRDEVWLQANPDRAGMLCIACLESRLGRRLSPLDFTGGSVNCGRHSERLRDRITGDGPP